MASSPWPSVPGCRAAIVPSSQCPCVAPKPRKAPVSWTVPESSCILDGQPRWCACPWPWWPNPFPPYVSPNLVSSASTLSYFISFAISRLVYFQFIVTAMILCTSTTRDLLYHFFCHVLCCARNRWTMLLVFSQTQTCSYLFKKNISLNSLRTMPK